MANSKQSGTSLENYRERYAAPEEVLADAGLSQDRRRAILEAWERDARELSVAEEEGMTGGERAMLDRVLAALHELGEDEAQGGARDKQG